MTFFSKTVPNTQEMFLTIRQCIKGKETPTDEQLKRIYELLKENSIAEGERIFVVMTAQSKGWAFAKDLDFYQAGDIPIFNSWLNQFLFFVQFLRR